MSRKPLDLPNIEDATLRACLAPLMGEMRSVAETTATDAPPRAPEPGEAADTSGALAVWRAEADEDFDVFRTVDRFLAMTDADLEAAAAAYPRQFAGTAARIGRIKARLEARYQSVAAAELLLRRAMDRVAVSETQAAGRPGQG